MGKSVDLVWKLIEALKFKSYGKMLGMDIWRKNLVEYKKMALEQVWYKEDRVNRRKLSTIKISIWCALKISSKLKKVQWAFDEFIIRLNIKRL